MLSDAGLFYVLGSARRAWSHWASCSEAPMRRCQNQGPLLSWGLRHFVL